LDRIVKGFIMDEETFFIATKADLRSIREKLAHPDTCHEAKDMLKQILRTKERLFWQTDSPEGCAALFSLAGELLRQVRVIEGILDDLNEKYLSRALSKLDWYEDNVVIPEDKREIEFVREIMDQENHSTLSGGEDSVGSLLAFEQCFFHYKQQMLFSKVVRPGI